MSKAGDQEYNQALDAVEAGKLSQAIHAVEAALMSDAKDSGYWQLYSVLLSQVGRIEDAEKAKNKAVEKDSFCSKVPYQFFHYFSTTASLQIEEDPVFI